MKIAIVPSTLFCVALGACMTESEGDETEVFRQIEPVCVEAVGDANDEWTCSESLEVECASDPMPEEIYVVLENHDTELQCDELDLAPIDGPFEVGSHEIVVVDVNSGATVCTTELRVVDETPPEVVDQTVELWPPNHKMVDVDVLDCFEEVIECNDDWHARLLWASSDESNDDTGDGSTDVDISFVSDEMVRLRAERDGGGNGRVYWLGYEVEDSSGNTTEGDCRVVVPHDQGGDEPVDDGTRYVVDR